MGGGWVGGGFSVVGPCAYPDSCRLEKTRGLARPEFYLCTLLHAACIHSDLVAGWGGLFSFFGVCVGGGFHYVRGPCVLEHGARIAIGTARVRRVSTGHLFCKPTNAVKL